DATFHYMTDMRRGFRLWRPGRARCMTLPKMSGGCRARLCKQARKSARRPGRPARKAASRSPRALFRQAVQVRDVLAEIILAQMAGNGAMDFDSGFVHQLFDPEPR